VAGGSLILAVWRGGFACARRINEKTRAVRRHHHRGVTVLEIESGKEVRFRFGFGER